MSDNYPPLEPAIDHGDYIKAVEDIRAQVLELQEKYHHSLPMWTVYGPAPLDQEGLFVARLWLMIPQPMPTQTLLRATSLAQIRDLLPPGLTCLRRKFGDDFNIIEVWL